MAKGVTFLKIFVPFMAVFVMSGADAAVVQRGTVARTSSASAKSADKDDVFAQKIREQRDAMDSAQALETAADALRVARVTGKNSCDVALRRCMQSKCGNDFSKCAADTDTSWGDKMDSCRRDTECTGAEYAAFAPEIKADRDANAELANFNAIVDCGGRYNACILEECGTTFSKCIGKSAGDAAIAKCKKIQTECANMDNGLAARMTTVLAGVRQGAEKQVQRDMERLYTLRDDMRAACERVGAMFDNRSLDCVYTINFFADAATTPYASKKAYAGSVFNCEPGWFGIDITTFKENAYRLTRAQSSASAAMMGSGLGVAAGAITSGAIDRALETQQAKEELDALKAGDVPTKERASAMTKNSTKQSSNNKGGDEKPTEHKGDKESTPVSSDESRKSLAKAGSEMLRQKVAGAKDLNESQKKLLESVKQDNKGGLKTPELDIKTLKPLPFTPNAGE